METTCLVVYSSAPLGEGVQAANQGGPAEHTDFNSKVIQVWWLPLGQECGPCWKCCYTRSHTPSCGQEKKKFPPHPPLPHPTSHPSSLTIPAQPRAKHGAASILFLKLRIQLQVRADAVCLWNSPSSLKSVPLFSGTSEFPIGLTVRMRNE